MERHTDPEVLLACSRVYEVLCQDDLSIAANCQTVRATLFDRLTDLYRRAFLSYFNEQVRPLTSVYFMGNFFSSAMLPLIAFPLPNRGMSQIMMMNSTLSLRSSVSMPFSREFVS